MKVIHARFKDLTDREVEFKELLNRSRIDFWRERGILEI
jgi:hypothetical protein